MKKLFMFLAVAGLATFGASCSSDDSKNDDPKQKDLVLSGKTDVKEGDAVTFTVKVGDKAEAGTDLYVAGEKVSNPYTFTKKGEYKVQAKKNGFNDSNVLTVKVSEKDIVTPDPKTLVLSVAGASEVEEGAEVNFIVKDGSGAVVAGVVIKKGTEVVSNPWIAAGEGTFKFVASKEGYENSNEVSVKVNASTVAGENQLVLEGITYNLDFSQMTINGVKQTDGTFLPKQYPLNGGGFAYIYGVNIIDQTEANWNSRKIFTRFEFAIPQVAGQATKNPFNTPVSEWIIIDLFAIKGQEVYSDVTEDTTFRVAAVLENTVFMLDSQGEFTQPTANKYDIKYNKTTDALYYSEVPAGDASLTAVKANKKSNRVAKVATVRAN
ncbi:hypothetical protein [Myroides sp. TSA_177.3]|uniref:hypothetical protein n=1 Tax=Myroides sp. TSA_177.3 TaxID=3415650 RepID=UPI0040457D24